MIVLYRISLMKVGSIFNWIELIVLFAKKVKAFVQSNMFYDVFYL